MVPIYLGEISPPAFRASFGGLAYQLGNMASSAAAQIEATAGESLKLEGTETPDYVSQPIFPFSHVQPNPDPNPHPHPHLYPHLVATLTLTTQ